MTEPRCYTVEQVLAALQMSARTFRRHRAAGRLPFLEELHPRFGRQPRYRADLVDAYFSGTFKPEMARAYLKVVSRRRSGNRSA